MRTYSSVFLTPGEVLALGVEGAEDDSRLAEGGAKEVRPTWKQER